MNFSTAIGSLRDGYAAKRPSWRGYIECVANATAYFTLNPPASVGNPTDEETAAAQTAISDGWKILKFHLADGETVVDYVFDSNASNDIKKDGSVVKKGGTSQTVYTGFIPLTQYLLDAILEQDWEVGLASDYATSATSSNEY